MGKCKTIDMRAKKKFITFEDHLAKRYGKRGTEARNAFDIKAKAFVIGELIKEEKRIAKLTHGS